VAEALAFYPLAGLVVAGLIGVLASREIVRCAVWLCASLVGVAGLFLLLGAGYLAAVQLLVYVGGILVVIVFGVMLTARRPMMHLKPPLRETLAAAATMLALGGGLLWAVLAQPLPEIPAQAGSAASSAGMSDIGRELVTTWLLPFELISVLLLAAMIGAAYLARPLRAADRASQDETRGEHA